MRSILTSHAKVIETTQKHILWTFWDVSMIIKCGLKIGLFMSEPYYFKFLFTNLLCPAVWLSDIWQIIDNSSKCVFDLLNVFSECIQWITSPQRATSWKFYYLIICFSISARSLCALNTFSSNIDIHIWFFASKSQSRIGKNCLL